MSQIREQQQQQEVAMEREEVAHRGAQEAAAGGGKRAAKQVKFQVAHCSGEDPEFPAAELNTHSPQTRGWQSPPFCAYPQEIGLEFLVGEVQLSQLQILSHESKIATKIDVYVGGGASYETCTFRRLGHLSLDDNERSDFAARELKSVYIGKQGRFLKLLIHKCHLNRHNIYNQAGIIAINVLGVEVGPSGPGGARYAAPAPRSVPPLEDLAFDMNFDKPTAQLLRRLHQAKEEAVASEDFELAKELKHAQDQLKHVGVKLAELESAKRAAVQREDYDRAAVIKHEVNALRAEVDDMTAPFLGGHARQGRGGGNHSSHFAGSLAPGVGAPGRLRGAPGLPESQFGGNAPIGQHFNSNNNNNNNSPHHGYGGPVEFGGASPHHEDERPLPVLQQKSPASAVRSARSFAGAGPGGLNSNAGHPLPGGADGGALRPLGEGIPGAGLGSVDGPENDDGAAYEPVADPKEVEEALGAVANYEELPIAESLPVGLGNETQPLVEMFGEYLVRCLYSRQVKLRGAALQALESGMHKYEVASARDLSAFASVCKLASTDKIANVYIQGLKVLELATTKAHALKRADMHALEALLSTLVERLGNNTARIRSASTHALTHLATLKNVGPQVITNYVLRQTRQGKTLLWRQLLGRLKLVCDLIHTYGLRDEAGLGLEQIMAFATANNAFAHPHAEVREVTKELVMQAYSHAGEAVLPYIKDLRPKQMEEYQLGFDKVDQNHGRAPARGQSESAATGPGSGRKKASHMSNKSSSPGASSQSSRTRAHDERPGSRSARRRDTHDRDAEASEGDEGNEGTLARSGGRGGSNSDVNININVTGATSPDLAAEDSDDPDAEPFTCQFCNRYDPSFTEDALDMHYWKECPVLTNCAQCEQVIEVALLNDHLLNECENKSNHRQCPRCKEAIASQFFQQHVDRASCLPAKSLDKANRCPLCHSDCKPGQEGWRHHMLAGKGCPKNPRTEHLRP